MQQVIMIGLDGATFTVLDRLIADGVMPFLRQFSTNGVRSKLFSTTNPLTPPAWISMLTGRNPGNHGVMDFLTPMQKEDGIFVKFNDSHDIQCETVWSIAGRQGKRVAGLNFYGMNPAFPVNGFLVSGFTPWKHLKRATWPPEFYQTVKSIADIKKLGFDLEQEKKCLQDNQMSPDEAEVWLKSHMAREQNWFAVLENIMRTDPCDLTAVVFDGVDKIQHLFWPYLLPELLPDGDDSQQRKIQNLCLDYYRQLDKIIAKIVGMAGDDCQILITSDHGFGTTTEIFYLNKWLHDQGYLTWSNPDVVDQVGQLTENRISSHMGLIDFKKTTAFAWTPSSNGVFIRQAKSPADPGIQPEEYEAFREKIRQDLLAFRDPDTGEQVVTQVLTREEACPGKFSKMAPDLMLILRDHGMVSILNSDRSLIKRSEAAGCHHPEGILIAGGAGICSGKKIGSTNITDVTPMLLYGLGLPVPHDLEGEVPSALYEPDFLKKHPVVKDGMTNPVAGGIPVRQEDELTPKEEEAMLDQLRLLGYV